MGERELMTGNDAIGEGAMHAACDCYFGYPITPQNELTAYMALNMPANGRVFVQAESELAAVNMVFGASAAGKRAMTSSSSPGISLKQEGISYLAGAELPSVIANVQRAGPGLGNIDPGQADYFQATRGGGHGGYRTIVLAPSVVQECYDYTRLAFDLADRYRMPVLILSDGRLGQTMEPLTVRPNEKPKVTEKSSWALLGAKNRPQHIVRSYYATSQLLGEVNDRLQARYREIEAKETFFDELRAADAEILLVAYGTSARLCRGAVREARKQGMKLGLFRPITLWPFPKKALVRASKKVKAILTVEMSPGQLVEDVLLSVLSAVPVHLLGTYGGRTMSETEIIAKAMSLLGAKKSKKSARKKG